MVPLRRHPRFGQFRLHRRLHRVQGVADIGRIVRQGDVELALALQDAALAEPRG